MDHLEAGWIALLPSPHLSLVPGALVPPAPYPWRYGSYLFSGLGLQDFLGWSSYTPHPTSRHFFYPPLDAIMPLGGVAIMPFGQGGIRLRGWAAVFFGLSKFLFQSLCNKGNNIIMHQFFRGIPWQICIILFFNTEYDDILVFLDGKMQSFPLEPCGVMCWAFCGWVWVSPR